MFEDFITSLEESEIKEVAKGILEIIEKSSPDNFLFKARTFEDNLSWPASQNLILSIAVMSESFPKSGDFFSFGMAGAHAQAAIFIYNLRKKSQRRTRYF